MESNENIFWIYDVVKKYIELDTNIFDKLMKKPFNNHKVEKILDLVKNSKKPIVSINGLLFNNYGPTYRALEEGV